MVSERVGLVNSAARSESLFADGERNKVGKFGWLGGSDANVRGRRDAEQQCSQKQSWLWRPLRLWFEPFSRPGIYIREAYIASLHKVSNSGWPP